MNDYRITEQLSGHTPEQAERLGFKTQPLPSDFNYHQVLDFENPNQELVERFIKDSSSAGSLPFSGKYGICSLMGLGIHEEYSHGRSGIIPYFLVGPVNISEGSLGIQSLKDFCRRTQRIAPKARINIASYYDLEKGIDESFSPRDFDHFEKTNTIFPDEEIDGWMGPSMMDLFNNIVCETIRIKYQSDRVLTRESNSKLLHARAEAREEITELGKTFASKRLWHRSTTDGAIMINTHSGWLASQTKTDKTDLLPDSFSLIIDSNKEINTIKYEGYRLPSSDTPEYAELIKSYQEAGLDIPKMIVHFHHPTLTRSSEYPENTTDDELEYGVFESGETIFKELQKRGTNWLILKNHGFLWLGNSTKEFEEFLENTLGLS